MPIKNQLVPLINTKLKPPRVNQDVLSRPRLIATLEKNQDKILTLVMGPAGFGKTTLLNQWRDVCEANGRQVSWLTLDQYDNQIDQFLAYLCASFKVLEPKISVQVEEFLELSSAVMPRVIVTELINSLAEFDSQYSLFLDDYHEISNQQVHDVVQLLLNNLPHNLNLYLGSREVPTLSLSRLKVAGQVMLIGYENMLFSEDETRQYFEQQHGFALSQQQLDNILNGTQGWPAAIQLAALSLHQASDGNKVIDSMMASSQSVTYFLAEEIFSQISEQTRECLMALSVVERFCQPLCEAMIDGVSFEQVVNSPLGSGLLQRLEGREHWYRFHPLIRDFLLGQLKERGFSQQLSFHRKAAEWFEQQGFVVEAVNHFTQSGDQDEIFDLLDKYATEMLEQGQLQLLLSLVEQLPEAQIKSCHKILLPLVWSKVLVHELDDVPVLLAHIEPQLDQPDNARQAQTISEIGIIKASSLIYRDDFEGSEQQLDQFLDLLGPEQSFVEALGHNIRSLCYLNKFQWDDFYQSQQRVFGFKSQLTNYGVFVYTHLFTGLAAFEQGRLSQVTNAVMAIENIPITNHDSAKEILALGKLLQALYLHQTGDVVGALKMIDANVLAMNHYAFVDLLLKLTIAKGRSLQQQGLLQQAVTFYLQINDIAKSRQSQRLQACVLHELVRMHLNNKNQAAANKLLKQWPHDNCTSDIQTGPLAQTWEWLELANIRIALHMEQYDEIATRLERLNTQFSAQGRLYHHLEVLLLITTLHYQQKNAELTQQALSEALAIDPEHVWLQPFVEQGSALLPCYRQFLRGEHPPLQISLCKSVIKHLVATADHIPQVSSNTPPEMALIDPITPKELRVLNLVAQGLSNREVADKLSVSTETVKSHLKSIYSKMGVNRRTQAVNLARDLNLLDI